MQRTLATAILLSLLACDDDGPAVVLEIASDLAIPGETNTLVARVQQDGATLAEETYPLGDPPRDQWPQTLPIVAGARADDRVMVAAELRVSTPGMPSVVVGYGEREVAFPRRGYETLRLDVPRSCIDADSDGFGIGFGCKRPDCDDTDPRVPEEEFCPGQFPDAGIPDVPDAGPPQDGGPDAGVGPDSGTEICNGEICQPNERCLMNQCLRECSTSQDCGTIELACLEQFGVCICRVPCFNRGQDCGPYECVDGCCRI